jgi:flagellin-like hook-associated protein FlgL
MAIIPVPILRSSDVLVQQRLLTQIQFDQLSLLKLQDQLSTGRRISVPSDDASASVRAIGLQRLLEQKGHSQRNLEATQSYLAGTDSAVSGVSQLVIDMRALAISMVDNTRTDLEREAATTEINRAIEQIVNDANRQFRGRSLFSGTESGIAAFSFQKQYVVYEGNEGDLESYADVGLRFDANLTGSEVFGGLSVEKQGVVDLNPIITANTRLSDLRGGAGVTKTSVLVSDGVSDSVIDVSGAETVGDVVALLEANPPAGRKLTVRLTNSGLALELDTAGGGNLNVREVGGGTTAAELGIFDPQGVGVNQLVGDDLNPILRKTTLLSGVLGSRATAVLRSTASGPGLVEFNNDIVFDALLRGESFNDVRIHYVDDGALQAAAGLEAGTEVARYEETATAASTALTLGGLNNNLVLTANAAGLEYNNVEIRVLDGGALGTAANVVYNASTKVLEVRVDQAGNTEIQNVINEINANSPFTATYDGSDPADGGFNPTAQVLASDINSVTANTANSGGDANTIFINIQAGATTAEQVVAALRDPTSGVPARFDVQLDAKDANEFGEPGSGFVDVAAVAATAGGAGEEFDKGAGFQVVNGGESYTIDIQAAETVEDLLNILNGSNAFVFAEINSSGSGVNVRSRLSGSDFQIGENGGQTATQLGIRTFTTDSLLADFNHGRGVDSEVGADFVIRRTDGVELSIDISTAATVQDVLDLINNHPDNSAPGSIEARLALSGNGIQILDSAPGTTALAVLRTSNSEAAWDLGLIARGEAEAFASVGAPPEPATALIAFAAPNDVDTAFGIEAKQAGSTYNGVQVVIDTSGVSQTPTVVFDGGAGTLTITVDPTQTTTADVVGAINGDAGLPFTAALDTSTDPNNDGSGLVVQPGIAALASGGTINPVAQPATSVAAFPAPNDLNSSIRFTATQTGTTFNDVQVIFQDTGGPVAASYNAVAKTLTIDINQGVTTANDVLAALGSVTEFTAALETSVDPGNDGAGLVLAQTFTTGGGSPEIIAGSDVNSSETKSIFNTLIKLNEALLDGDLREIERLVEEIDTDFRRINFARAEVGARQQALDSLQIRLEDEHVELRRTISLEIDVDLVNTISDLTARQAAFEASLRLIGRTFQLSLLQFI